MPLALQAVLVLALAAVAVSLVLLLLELRRALRGFEAFLAAAQHDLADLVEDAHATRRRMEEVTTALQPRLLALDQVAQAVRDAGDLVRGWMSTYRRGLDRGADLLGMALGAARAFSRPEPDSRR